MSKEYKEDLGYGVTVDVDDDGDVILEAAEGDVRIFLNYAATKALLAWIKKHLPEVVPAFFLFILTACAYVPLPTEPSPVAASEVRQPTQMIVRVVGPSGWYSDRIYVDAYVLDQRGAKLDGVVRCEPSQGHLEPAQWDTTSRSGTLWIGTAPGATFVCRNLSSPAVEAGYDVTAVDFEMPRGCCGGTPKPPVVVPPAVPPTKPPSDDS